MRTGRMQWCGGRVTFFAAIVVMAAAFALGDLPVQAQPSPCNGSPPCENRMSVSSAGPAPVGATVDVNVSIDTATTPYQGYDAAIEYDSSIVSFSSVQFGWGSPCLLEPCWQDVSAGGGLRQTRLWASLASGTTTSTGVVAQVDYQCVGVGVTTLRLVPPPDAGFHSTTTRDAGGTAIPTGLTAGQITCSAPAETATPTSTPTATSTPSPTATSPPAVGGIAQFPALSGGLANESEASGYSGNREAALVIAGIAGAAAITSVAWYARRRWMR